jgi:SAM-dependent methyltransferase
MKPAASPPSTQYVKCSSCGAASGFVVRHEAANSYERDSRLKVVSCSACGLIFLNPQYTQRAYTDFYASHYYRDVPEDVLDRNRIELGNSYLRHYQDIFSLFARDLQPRDRVLDIGSGHGTWLRLLFRFAASIRPENVTALEPSSEACDTLRQQFPAIDVVQDVLSSARLPGGVFDAILCGALIEHLTDPLQGLVEMNHLLRPGGRLFLVTPSTEPRSFRYGLDRFFKFVHTTYFTESTLASMLAKSGFEIAHSRTDPGNDLGMLWCPTILLIARKVRSVTPPVRSFIASDKANATAVETLFTTARATERILPRWRAPLLKVARAAYRITMPSL